MIQLPRRSVTRFFIPLIDVLILLFCIFLLMPFVSQPGEQTGGGDPEQFEGAQAYADPTIPGNVEDLRKELVQMREEIRRLKLRQLSVAENLSPRVLEIDKNSGRLYYYDPERREIRSEQDARQLIAQHRRQSGAKEAFFLILYPREISGFPLQAQIERYRRWFRDVPYGFNNPLASE